jgi:hypothetical protein
MSISFVTDGGLIKTHRVKMKRYVLSSYRQH